jgi:hypothetical protein
MLDIRAPLFSTSELGKVTGIDRKLVNLWLERELVRPTRLERMAVRNRPRFSVVDIFKARLNRTLSDRLLIGLSASTDAGEEAERAADPKAASRYMLPGAAHVLADEGWMWAVARSVERGKPLEVFAAIAWVDGCWDLWLELEAEKLASPFGPEVPYIVVPVGAIFACVYGQCKALLEGSERPRKKRRARS